MPDGVQQVNRVPGKALDALGQNDVDLSCVAVSQKTIELVTVFCSDAGDAAIRIHPCILPFGMPLDQGAVVAHLRRKRVLHPRRFYGYSGIGGDPFFPGLRRCLRGKLFNGFQGLSLL